MGEPVEGGVIGVACRAGGSRLRLQAGEVVEGHDKV